MTFNVDLLPSVADALTELWLAASDKQAVTDAANWIERELKTNPLSKVTRVDDHYFIHRDPLVALSRIRVDQQSVMIVEIHRVG